jgi:serine/threonine protein kinase
MAAPGNESKIPVGTVLVGKYRVTREIGRGGMAAVYEAEHLTLGKKVAVKVLASELANSTVVIERFFREARAAASVKSPNIVDIYDSSRLEDGRPFIAMEMLEGESLYDRMARIRIIDPKSTARIIMQCCKGLAKAHAAGIVHRDLKPENIFITKAEDGEELVKLLDFGLAKFYAPVDTDEKSARLTREGAVFGTPAYMSPEQVKGQGNVDFRADLWALGCMAFECLIGRPVWNTDQGVAMTFAAIAQGPVPVPSKLRQDLPPTFDLWFKKALERDPNNRFQSAKELAEELARALNATSHVSLPSMSGDIEAQSYEAATELLIADTNGVTSQAYGRSSDGSPAPNELTVKPLPESLVPPGLRSPGAWRLLLSGTLLLGTLVGAYITWSRVLRPQILTPVVESKAATLPSATATTPDGSILSTPTPDEPRWSLLMSEAQKLFSEGNVDAAIKKLREAQEQGAGLAAKSLHDQMRSGNTSHDPCRLAAVSHPRIGVAGSAERPAVAATSKGAVVAWSDDHEQATHDHLYTVLLDPTGRPTSKPRDVTPEGNHVVRPTLLSVGDRVVLLYWDKGGREPGVRVRWLDDEGVISGASRLVMAGPRTGNFWPVIEKAPDGFFVAWQDDRDKEGDDIFLRRLGAGLEPLGSEIRVTDYLSVGKGAAHARVPSIAFANNTLLVVYRVERAKSALIQRLMLPLSMEELTGVGLEDKALNTPAKDRRERTLGTPVIVNEDRAPADAPAVACGREGCFVAWHGEQGGAYAALIEPIGGSVVWRKKFSAQGGHPTLAVNGEGQVMTAYYEQGRVKVALITKSGVGTPSTAGRVTGDQPRPWLSAGTAKGEWYVTWQDQEGTNRTEPIVARIGCR